MLYAKYEIRKKNFNKASTVYIHRIYFENQTLFGKNSQIIGVYAFFTAFMLFIKWESEIA